MGPEPEAPRTPPLDAPQSVLITFTPSGVNTVVTIIHRYTRGRIRWDQRRGTLVFPEVTDQDFTDLWSGIREVCRLLAATLEA